MGKMGSFKLSGLEELQEEIRKLQNPDTFVEACAKDLAARLLAMVVERTPVGDYSQRKDGRNTAEGMDIRVP